MSGIDHTHTERILRECAAADRFSRENGVPRREAQTIMGAVYDALTPEERQQIQDVHDLHAARAVSQAEDCPDQT